ncbi:MAG: ribosome maturation factor RimM [Lachnospiraceae bacterium]|nr:ribosome maturation factor RimM [Lachnospiraceae bacterium]
MEQYLKIGIITSTHGIRGEVKVFPTTDDPGRFKKLKTVYMKQGTAYMPMDLDGVKFFKNMVILKFKGLDNINLVEKFRQTELYVDRAHAVPLGENENFIADLIDLKVITDEGEELGVLTDVLQTGANDVYIVQTERYGEVMIPAIRQCILKVDLEEETMLVHLLPGLLEL